MYICLSKAIWKAQVENSGCSFVLVFDEKAIVPWKICISNTIRIYENAIDLLIEILGSFFSIAYSFINWEKVRIASKLVRNSCHSRTFEMCTKRYTTNKLGNPSIIFIAMFSGLFSFLFIKTPKRPMFHFLLPIIIIWLYWCSVHLSCSSYMFMHPSMKQLGNFGLLCTIRRYSLWYLCMQLQWVFLHWRSCLWHQP